MLDNCLSTIRRLLVIQAEPAAADAIAALHHQTALCITVLKVQEDNGSSLSYVIQGEVPLTIYDISQFQTIQWIQDQRVDAALFFMPPGRSPYVWAYRCYLAGVPSRIGLSQEFGGQVLSHEIAPPAGLADPHLYLLHTCGLLTATPRTEQPAKAIS